jgi:hypothetical protein
MVRMACSVIWLEEIRWERRVEMTTSMDLEPSERTACGFD